MDWHKDHSKSSTNSVLRNVAQINQQNTTQDARKYRRTHLFPAATKHYLSMLFLIELIVLALPPEEDYSSGDNLVTEARLS